MAVKKLRFLLLLVLLLVIYVGANALSIWSYASKDETQKADVAVVLGAAAYESGVSAVYRERLNHGIRLYEEGYTDYILICGGVAAGNTHSDAQIGKDYVLNQGVPENAVLLEETSTITQENLENAKTIMDEKGLATALVVSDPLHMRRAMRMAKDCGMTAYASPTPTTMYRSTDKKIEFLKRETFYYVGYKWFQLLGLRYC